VTETNAVIDMRFEVFMLMRIQGMVFWILMCSDMVGYQCLGGPCCLAGWSEDRGSMVVLNVGIIPYHYMMSQPRRLWCKVLLLFTNTIFIIYIVGSCIPIRNKIMCVNMWIK